MSSDGDAKTLLIEEEMRESYLTYAMSVLVDRALPDLRDGLKPVHRRILQSMRDLNLTAGAKYQKSATIVGHCLGRYHPHGDTSVYDAMVRLAQDFSLRYTLADGQGNFGSIEGDSAAAYRYTEARMSPLGDMMMEDIQYDTVQHRKNFDGEHEEPTVLPAKLPNLLVNGSSGIAVGMATNIPPHNLREVCDAIIHLLEQPSATVAELMRFIRAPDFPTGGYICGTAGLREAYETGRGRVVMRARIEKDVHDHRDCLIVTEIPYGIKLGTIIESISQAHADERLKGLNNVNNLSSDGKIRLMLGLKKGEDPDLMLNLLWEHTNLQYSFAINMVALDGGRPRTVNLRRMCQAYIEHRKEVIVRRTRFLLIREEARIHIVEGQLKAIDVIDEVIRIIRAAESVEAARQQLIAAFAFSERQAQAILDMQLRRLTGLERGRLESERAELQKAIDDYRDLLARDERQYALIREDLVRLREKHGDDRRTEIIAAASDLVMEDLIEDRPCANTLTHSGYVKRLPTETFRLQRRGGKGDSGGSLKNEEDFLARVFAATNHQTLLVFTTMGKAYMLKAYQIPESGRTARGIHLANLLSMAADERITEIIPVTEFLDNRFLLMATAQGQVKKTELAAYANRRNSGLKAIKLAEGDHLVDVVITSGQDEVLVATADGQACRFHEQDCRPMGRDTSGVVGIDLAAGSKVVSLLCIASTAVPGIPVPEILTICMNGYGKRTPFEEYRLTRRGGKGVINIDTSERNGPVLASLAVSPGDQLMLMTTKGQVIRLPIDGIRSTGRNAQGVKIVEIEPGDTLSGATLLPREDEVVSDESSPGPGPGDAPAPA